MSTAWRPLAAPSSAGICDFEMAESMIQIASDFSRFPGGRYASDGPHSGELFRTSILEPALRKYEKVVVVLDGVVGLPASFLEEAFGGLIRDGFSLADLSSRLEIKAATKRLQRYPSQIWGYIDSAGQPLTRVN